MAFYFMQVFDNFRGRTFHDGLITHAQNYYHNNTYKHDEIVLIGESVKINAFKIRHVACSWMLLATLQAAHNYADTLPFVCVRVLFRRQMTATTQTPDGAEERGPPYSKMA